VRGAGGDRFMILKGIDRGELGSYVAAQLDHFFPDRRPGAAEVVERNLDEALARLKRCIDGVRMWKPGEFDYLHSSQYAIFLYYLANTAWRNDRAERVCTKLFYLNKALNGFECFYDNDLPEVFFIGHTVGIVLVRAKYPNYLALYQNCTVGKNHGDTPEFEDGVVMYPGSAVIGRCKVRARSYLAQGASLVNADTPGDCLVFSGGRGPVFKRARRDILADIFRL
jgi:serine O-acetyltransferase